MNCYSEGSRAEPEFIFVFCPLRYNFQNDFLNDLETLKAKLFVTEPFSDFSSCIEFYYVSLNKKEEKYYFKHTGSFPPLRVRKSFVNILKSRLKGKKCKFIIIDAEGVSSCAELSKAGRFSLVILGRAMYRIRMTLRKAFCMN